MRIKVELHREVVGFVRHDADESEIKAFYEALDRLAADPVALIENSEPVRRPGVSRYMLRFFRFGRCIAIFETNRARDRIRVRECQRIPPKRREAQGRGSDP
ncbi:MAG: hypothetical protein IH989_06140 [Planctomycetes bacterium]|nr:hypothetical protein [Planctomycetota bacterium]